MTHTIHVYPIFRVELEGLHGTPEEMVAAAEDSVAVALNTRQDFGGIDVPGQRHCPRVVFAESFDGALVDVMAGKRRVRSFTQSEQYDKAQAYAATLAEMIDGKDDDLGELLGPIKAFLETIH